jgi:hypothetical protein
MLCGFFHLKKVRLGQARIESRLGHKTIKEKEILRETVFTVI